MRSDVSGRVLVDDAAGASAPPSSARTMVRSDVSGRVPVDDAAGAGGRVRVLVDDAAGSRVLVDDAAGSRVLVDDAFTEKRQAIRSVYQARQISY